jgi:hypothetical protein
MSALLAVPLAAAAESIGWAADRGLPNSTIPRHSTAGMPRIPTR